MTEQLAARLGRATLGNSAWYLDQWITFLAIGEDTDGHFSLLKVQGVQGAKQSLHSHTHEAETIYLLEGGLTVLAGEEELRLGPGDIVTIPRGLLHAIRHDTSAVTFLLQYSPAGFEHYFHELSEPAQYLGLPPQPTTPDPILVAVAAARYGCVFPDRRTGPALRR
jgi:quercetin dioxygenase-like cupin family protein